MRPLWSAEALSRYDCIVRREWGEGKRRNFKNAWTIYRKLCRLFYSLTSRKQISTKQFLGEAAANLVEVKESAENV